MVSIMTTITLPEDIAYNEDFIKIRKRKGISNLIQRLLRQHLTIVKEMMPEGEIEIDDEMMQLQVRMAKLKEKKEEMKKKEEEERKRWVRV